jgi:hypothetical protein
MPSEEVPPIAVNYQASHDRLYFTVSMIGLTGTFLVDGTNKRPYHWTQ